MKNRKPRSDKGKSRKPYKHSLESVQSTPGISKEETRDIILMEKPDKDLTYDDLPKSTKDGIERVLKYRRSLGLQDDSEDRKRRALNYYKFEMGRK